MSNVKFKKAFVLLLLFISTALLVQFATPKQSTIIKNTVNLEQHIPIEIGKWKAVKKNNLLLINAQENELVNKLYSQVFERTYVDYSGQVLMLSIAYGAEQRRDMMAHFPEVCYPAQGFNINKTEIKNMSLFDQTYSVKHLVSQKGARVEDITYWVRVGNKIVATRSAQKLEAIKYGLQGIIPDGLIFRVSTLGVVDSFSVHEGFVQNLLANVNADTQDFLISGIK